MNGISKEVHGTVLGVFVYLFLKFLDGLIERFVDKAATCAMSAAFCSIKLRTNSSVIMIDIQTTFFPVIDVSILLEIQKKSELDKNQL